MTNAQALFANWRKNISTKENGFFNLALGLASKQEQKEWKEALSSDHITASKIQGFFKKFSNSLLEDFRQEIWKPRCSRVQDLEKTLGIDKRTKRKRHKRNPKLKEKKNINQTLPAVSNTIKNNIASTSTITFFKDKLDQIIESWVKDRKFWLGI
jgi:hypothetical protein